MAGRRPGIVETVGMQFRLAPGNDVKNRFAAEVVCRKPRNTRKIEAEKDADDVEVDLKLACSLKPAKRLTWLISACKMVKAGRATSKELFSIITTRRFTSGVSKTLGKAMVDTVYDIIDLFSDNQARHLRSDVWVLTGYKDTDDDGEDDNDRAQSEESEDKREEPADAPRDELPSDRRISTERSQPVPVKPKPGGWVSVSWDKEERVRREALEAREQRRQELQKAREREREDQQKAKKTQLEEDVDSSLQMLESMTQQRGESPRRSTASRDDRTTQRPRRDEPRRDTRGRRCLSRSRSVSIQLEPSLSPPRKRQRDNTSFEDALRQRMAERDRNDTTRGAVVQENHKVLPHRRLNFNGR